MERLKVCFVGVGSIARRHIRNLHTVCSERGIELHVDAYRRTKTLTEGVNEVYTSLHSVPNDYDIIFITNPTEMHLEALKQFHHKGKHFFIEKPVVSVKQIEAAQKFQARINSVYYVAGPLRYNAVIQWIKNNVDPMEVLSVRSISSSYLPDWRPGQDYRQTYSAHKDMGGGVSIDLIHEWDYLTYLYGWPENVYSIIGRKSELEIDSDDIAVYVAEYPHMIAEVHLDYFGRKTIREIQLFMKNDTIVGDIANNKIHFLVSGEELDFHEKRDDYQRKEIEFFLDMTEGTSCTDKGFKHALSVLGMTQGRISV